MPPADRIVWVDCEMTGLDIATDALIEVAVVVTDSELKPLDAGVDLLIRPPQQAVDAMNDFVRTMHTSSGLLAAVTGPDAMTMEAATLVVLDYVKQWVPEPGKAPLGGNSVGTDKAFLARDMPALTEHLHYRIIDVSTVKELARRWYPRVYYQSPEKHGGHRALADILESIDELRYYREALMPPQPGPTSDQAKAVAAHIVDTSVSGTISPPASA